MKLVKFTDKDIEVVVPADKIVVVARGLEQQEKKLTVMCLSGEPELYEYVSKEARDAAFSEIVRQLEES